MTSTADFLVTFLFWSNLIYAHTKKELDGIFHLSTRGRELSLENVALRTDDNYCAHN